MKKCPQPAGLWLSMLLGPADAEPVYDSLGYPTRVGADQLPGSCGETVRCLRCDQSFMSPDKRRVRLCPKCRGRKR